MRTYQRILFGAIALLFVALIVFLLSAPAPVSATSYPPCTPTECYALDDTITDFQVGQFKRTGLTNLGNNGSVQLLPVGLTSPWVADNKILPQGRAELATVMYNDMIYVIGGLASKSSQPLASILKAATDSNGAISPTGWTSAGNLPTGLSGMPAVVNGNWLYVLGGNMFNSLTLQNEYTSTIFYAQFDGNGNLGTWHTALMPPYGVPDNPLDPNLGALVYHQAVVNNGYLYVMGGQDFHDTIYDVFNKIYFAPLNASTGEVGAWTQATNLPIMPRKLFAAVTFNNPAGTDWLYLIGGLNDPSSFQPQSQVDYTTFNGADTNIFTNTNAALPQGYYAHGAVQYNGALFVTGGNDGSSADLSITNTVLSTIIQDNGSLMSFGTNVNWISSNPLPFGRKNHGTVVSRIGEIYVIGGYGPTGETTNTVYHGSTRGFGSQFAPNGTYTSKIIDKLNTEAVRKIIVNTTISSTVSMTLQYRHAATSGGIASSPWIDLPALDQGTQANKTFPITSFKDQFIQYRAWLTTSVASNTPMLNQIEFVYDPPPNPPDFVISGMSAPVASGMGTTQVITYWVYNSQAATSSPQPRANTKRAPLSFNIQPSTAFYVTFYANRTNAPSGPNDLTSKLECYDATNPQTIPPTARVWLFYNQRDTNQIFRQPMPFYARCDIPANSTNFWAQLDTCDTQTGDPTCNNYGYVAELGEPNSFSNNIIGPLQAGQVITNANPSGGTYLPYISKQP